MQTLKVYLYSSDGGVVKASASRVVDSGFILRGVKPMTVKLLFTASLFVAQHYGDSVDNKPASLLFVPLGKTLSGIPYFRMANRRPVTPNRAGYCASIALS